MLRALAEPNRQRILLLIWKSEKSAGEIAAHFDITFGAVSQHLLVLRKAGLVRQRKSGRYRYYRANKDAMGPLRRYLESVWRGHLQELKALSEIEEGKRSTK